MTSAARLVMLGRQGSGKGTQCARLAEELGLVHLSTGDLLRAAVRAGTRLGKEVQTFLDAGDLVPDEVMVELVAQSVNADDTAARGWILDGFPRTVAQADAFLGDHRRLDAAIELQIPDSLVLARLAARRVCPDCGWTTTVSRPGSRFVPCERCPGVAVTRADDQPAAIERRLSLYDAETAPLAGWFASRGLLVEVDGDGPADLVFRRVLAAVVPQLHVRAS